MNPATLQELAVTRRQDLRRTAVAVRHARLARRARRGGHGRGHGQR